MASLNRWAGAPVSGGDLVGRDLKFFVVTNTANDIGTADTTHADGYIVEGLLTKAIRAISAVATIEAIGAQANAGFTVVLSGYEGAKVSGSDVAAATHLDNIISTATGKADVTVAEKTLADADWA